MVACSFRVAHIITHQKTFKFNWPEVYLKEKSVYSMARVPYNKLLTNLACTSRTGEYWPSVVFVWTLWCSVCTVTTSCQYSPVRPLRSVSKRLLFFQMPTTMPFRSEALLSLNSFLTWHEFMSRIFHGYLLENLKSQSLNLSLPRRGALLSEVYSNQWCQKFWYNQLWSVKLTLLRQDNKVTFARVTRSKLGFSNSGQWISQTAVSYDDIKS